MGQPIKKHPSIHNFEGCALDNCALGTDKNLTGHGYTIHYEKYFEPFRHKPLKILEMGLGVAGASVKTWDRYFHYAEVYGVDIEERCKELDGGNIHITIGNLSDEKFVDEYITSVEGGWDIIIDDANHHVNQQKFLFRKFFPTVKDGGIYVVEDLGSSYWSSFGGAYRQEDTMVEYLKSLVDHPFHEMFKRNSYTNNPEVFGAKDIDKPITYLDQNIYSIHFYREICFVFKGGYR
jgi:demethylmacrocin O-methyltransferase